MTLSFPLIEYEDILKSPSFKDGISNGDEESQRIFTCKIIQQAVIMLELPQIVCVRAQILFLRFYVLKSMMEYDTILVALTSIFLACKLEEQPTRITKIIQIFFYIFQIRVGDQPHYIDIATSNAIKTSIISCEKTMLEIFGFQDDFDSPHKFLLVYLNVLDFNDKIIAQKAWNYLNDSLCTTLCLEFPPNVVAAGAIFCTSNDLYLGLSDSPPWFELFDAKKEEIDIVSKRLEDLYKKKEEDYKNFKSKHSIIEEFPLKSKKRKRDQETN